MKKPERRSLDQDAAVEHAFVAGTLPEDDRRAEEAIATVAVEPPNLYRDNSKPIAPAVPEPQ